MWSTVIILLPPVFNYLLRFVSCGKDPSVQTVVAKGPVKTFNEWVFPRTTGFDIKRMAVMIFQPLLECIGDELRPIVAAQVVRCASHQEQPIQDGNYLTRRNGTRHMDGQTFAGIFIEDRQQAQLATALGASLQK